VPAPAVVVVMAVVAVAVVGLEPPTMTGPDERND